MSRKEKMARRERRDARGRGLTRLQKNTTPEEYAILEKKEMEGDQYGRDEIVASFRANVFSSEGQKVDEDKAREYYQSELDSGKKFTGKAQEFLTEKLGMDFSKPKKDVKVDPVKEITDDKPKGGNGDINTGVIDESTNIGGKGKGGGITKTNTAINTGDITIGGDNTGTANTGVIDTSTNLASAGAASSNIGQKKETKEEAEKLKDAYVGGIIDKTNTATNTGNASVGGSNYGTVNTGVMDYSVNITGDGQGGGLSNFQAAAAGTALNENQYERSRLKLTGAGRAQAAIGQAQENVGAADSIKGLDTDTDEMSNYYRNLGKKNMVNLFGDIFSPDFGGFEFKAPKAPKPIKLKD